MIARSVAEGQRRRRCATCAATRKGALFGHPIGYSFVAAGRHASSRSSTTTSWSAKNPSSPRSSTSCAGGTQEGNDIVTNLDPAAQRIALDDLEAAGLRRVVAIEPQTGRVRVMASNPPYDPNRIPDDSRTAQHRPDAPLLNRATQGQYPPGSTFKVVTAAAALDSGTITPDTPIDAPGHARRRGAAAAQRLQRGLRADRPRHGADQLGQHLVRPARRAGRRGHAVRIHGSASASTRRRRSTCPTDQVSTERHLRRAATCSAADDPVDIARVAIGQERLLVTPLQMAEVAAAVANGGKLMKPQIWNRVVDPDGRVDQAARPLRVQRSRSARRPRQS